VGSNFLGDDRKDVYGVREVAQVGERGMKRKEDERGVENYRLWLQFIQTQA
jgi:hypothetical protein